MVNLSKRARELIKTYGTIGNVKRLTKELRGITKSRERYENSFCKYY